MSHLLTEQDSVEFLCIQTHCSMRIWEYTLAMQLDFAGCISVPCYIQRSFSINYNEKEGDQVTLYVGGTEVFPST